MSPQLVSTDVETTAIAAAAPGAALQQRLERAYGVQFAILDGQSGDVLRRAPSQPPRDWERCADVCREVARRGQPEFIDDEDPLITVALPWNDDSGAPQVAVATFLTRSIALDEDLSPQARRLGMCAEELSAWAPRQTPWTAESLRRMSDIVIEEAQARRQAHELQEENSDLSRHLASTYEEISLLHRLTQNLKLSKTGAELGMIALEWLGEVVPASSFVLQLAATPDGGSPAVPGAREPQPLLRFGACPIDAGRFAELIAHLKPIPQQPPTVVNRPITERPDWPCAEVRQAVVVALAEGENVFGWLAALNHAEDGEFGTVEASLLSSVATILGIHSGNVDLYRQQSELLAGIVRALTSAIDAKDPYTCGHSDRVARIAVRLAEELGCDKQTLDTLYLAGLLHDIGKIGIDDSVLRKAGKLSDEEYEHIKRHVEIGHRILRDLSKLREVLPVVLHHHESWDGHGYPHGLGVDRIPLSARIVAVADAFDAMSSDRPYRRRMPEEKVNDILRAGANQQWDPAVVDALLRVREDIRRIYGEEMPVSQLPASS